MKQISDSLMNIILPTLASIERYEIKCRLPKHNKIDKQLQDTLNVLILQDKNSFKALLGHADSLIDEIPINNTQIFKEKRFNDITSKLEFLHNHDMIIQDDLLQKINIIVDDLNKTSESIRRNITKFLSL